LRREENSQSLGDDVGKEDKKITATAIASI
jgi:hypothetical protein